MSTWPHWYAQASAWIVSAAGLGVLCMLAAAVLHDGVRRLFATLSWWPAFWEWWHKEWLPRYRQRKRNRAGDAPHV